MSDEITSDGSPDRLSADAKSSDIAQKFLAAIREGEAQADQGKVISHKQIKKDFASCILR